MRRRTILGVAAWPLACGGGGVAGESGGDGSTGNGTASATTSFTAGPVETGGGSSDGSTGDTEGASPWWQPGTVYPSATDPNPRGLLDVRGLVHSHSVYSHDACDDMPVDENGNRDEVCFEDLRRGMCQVMHDFLMLTDHRDAFDDHEFPEVLLYRPDRGDALIERGGVAVASWAACEDGVPTLVMGGCESETMPVGLEGHAPGRGDTYGSLTPEAIAEMKAQGAVVLVAHTENYTIEQLSVLPLDGFEMYNLHANMLANIAVAAELVGKVVADDPGLPHPDLLVMPLWQEDPRYLERWGGVLAGGTRRVTTMGTDSHRNTLPEEAADGERVDSFRRMMMMFSNHALVEPDGRGGWDDLAVKDALRAGRLYGAFEYMGYPLGFDARIESAAGTVEMGGEASLADAPEIVATLPTVRQLDPALEGPIVTAHVLRATMTGFEEVASSEGELHFAPSEPGAYRVEVRIVPLHLAGWLGDYADLAAEPRPWIYANPFYVVP
jgi:hypothetical protein